MTHVVRDITVKGPKVVQKEIIDAVTIIECPPMTIVGVVGYVETPSGLRGLTTVWHDQMSDSCKRRFYKNWYRSKKKAFTKYTSKATKEQGKSTQRNVEFDRITKYCQVVRVIAHTQIEKLNLRQKKAHIMEIQINGGTVDKKVKWAKDHLGKDIRISDVFQTNEFLDTIGVTKGHGFNGVVKRYGVRRLYKKTHRGFRKVACIGPWHPERVMHTVARAGQMGYHHRTERNKKIFRVGIGSTYGTKDNAKGSSDPTEKNITPLGGFPHYGVVEQDFVMLKGAVIGTKKRPITLRKAMFPPAGAKLVEQIDLKFVDTASKIGHGRFQTVEEKQKFYGTLKKNEKEEKGAKKVEEKDSK
jgi:large subunit ribosomal protein L3e